jgi:hypothetical protein
MNLLQKLKPSNEKKMEFDLRPQARAILQNKFESFQEWYDDKVRLVKKNSPEKILNGMPKEEFDRRARSVILKLSNLKHDIEHECGSYITIELENNERFCLGCLNNFHPLSEYEDVNG